MLANEILRQTVAENSVRLLRYQFHIQWVSKWFLVSPMRQIRTAAPFQEPRCAISEPGPTLRVGIVSGLGPNGIPTHCYSAVTKRAKSLAIMVAHGWPVAYQQTNYEVHLFSS